VIARDEQQRPRTTVDPVHSTVPPKALIRTAGPPFARPAQFAAALWRDLRRSRPLAWELAKRDLRIQYRHPLFGIAAVVLPLLAMAAVGLGFRASGLLIVDSVAIPYALFVFVGLVLWTTFLEALYAPMHALIAEQGMLARTAAPPEAVLLGKLGPLLANLGVKGLLLAICVGWYDLDLPGTLALAPLGFVALIALGLAVGLILAPLNLIYHDVSRLLVVVTTFWLFLSPVYFSVPATGVLGTIMSINPVTPLLAATRSALLTGDEIGSGLMFAMAGGALAFLGICWIYMRVTLPVVIERADG